jgi:hypothetical protein
LEKKRRLTLALKMRGASKSGSKDAGQANHKRGPKKSNRAAEVQSLFGVNSQPMQNKPVAATPQPPAKLTQTEIDQKVRQAVADVGKADYEKAIREYQIPLSSIPLPRKEDVFGNWSTLEPLLIVLLDEDVLIKRVAQGMLPVTTYATARELAKIVRNQWPAEMHSALTQYQELRLRKRK